MENCCCVLDVTCFAWRVSDGSLEIDWDDPSNIAKVRDRVKLLLRGCSYKKGYDTSCCCLKGGKKCGPGCRCCNCKNSPAVPEIDNETDEIEDEEEEENEALRQVYQKVMVQDEEQEGYSSTDEVSDMDCSASEEDTHLDSMILFS